MLKIRATGIICTFVVVCNWVIVPKFMFIIVNVKRYARLIVSLPTSDSDLIHMAVGSVPPLSDRPVVDTLVDAVDAPLETSTNRK